jgi:hypothetical protein
MAEPKDCPKCGLVNLPSTQRCDCGYDFVTGTTEQPYRSPGDRGRADGSSPEEILSEAEYRNYRNVRAVALLFIVLGGVLFLGGVSLAKQGSRAPDEQVPPAVAAGIAVVGLTGAVGGVATRLGSRRWAPLVKVMACLYVLAFPLGTILSYTLLRGLSEYLDCVDRVRRASAREDGWDDGDEEDE